MPLEDFQKEIFGLLAKNRNPDSYVAGGLVLNESQSAPRYSNDIDIFHSETMAVSGVAMQDAACLREHGISVEMDIVSDKFVRAVAQRGNLATRLDWGIDSAFRFFPIEEDPVFGYRLNFWDACVNKVLALAGRVNEQDLLRDTLDILEIDRTSLSLGTLCWAAVGKDPGWTPELLLNTIVMRVRFRDEHFSALKLRPDYTVRDFKIQWLQILDRAQSLIRSLPPEQAGCLYLDQTGQPVTPDPNHLTSVRPHYGSLGGAWPEVHSVNLSQSESPRDPEPGA